MIRLKLKFLNNAKIVSEIDEEGRFTYVSQHFLEVFGAVSEDFLHKPFTDFLQSHHNGSHTAGTSIFEEMCKGKGMQKQLNFYFRGKSKWFNSTLVRHLFSPEVKGYMLIQQNITSEKLLQDESQRLSMIVRDTSYAVLITDREERIQWANKAFETLSGHTLKEVVGKNPRIFQGEATNQSTRKHMRAQLDRHQPFSCEIMNYSKDGTEYWVNIDCQPMFQGDELVGFFSIQYDITKRKRYEHALIESEERFRNMADTAPVLIWKAGIDKQCNFFNQVWLNFTGRTVEQEWGFGWAEGVHPDDYKRCVAIYTQAFDRREPFSMEYRLRRHDGQYRWILDKGSPLFDKDQHFTGYIGSCVDIHDRKEAELKVHHQNDQLREIARLHSHEVRRPVATIIGLVNLIDRDALSYENAELFDMMLSTADELDTIIHKIVGQTHTIEEED